MVWFAATGRLDLRDANLTEWPSGDLERVGPRNVTAIFLSGNCIQRVPASVLQLVNLEALDLRGNCLTSIPPELGGLQHLRELLLDGNCLESLPDSLGGLASLRELSVASNRLLSLPACIGALPRLVSFRCGGNPLSVSAIKRAAGVPSREVHRGTFPLDSDGTLRLLRDLARSHGKAAPWPALPASRVHSCDRAFQGCSCCACCEECGRVPGHRNVSGKMTGGRTRSCACFGRMRDCTCFGRSEPHYSGSTCFRF